MEHVLTLLRTAITFILILILARIIGSKQLSQLTFFNYITGITIGSISANIISKGNEPFIDEFIGLVFWCFLTVLDGYLGMKSGKIRLLLDGQPIIVVKKGTIIKKALKRARLNMDELSMLLREANIFAITEVDYAILETNGQLSVLKKQKYLQATKEDMKIPMKKQLYLPSGVVSDGRIISNVLEEYALNEKWLIDMLKKQNIGSVKGVLYAELQEDGSLYVVKK